MGGRSKEGWPRMATMGTAPAPDVSNEAVVDAYDRLAAPYDWVLGPLEASTRDRALSLLSPDSGERILEAGCGPGHALVELARRVGAAGQVVGLDAAPEMLDRARTRVDHTNPPGRVALVRGDARSLPIPEGTADAVFIEDTLELFAAGERTALLSEIRRVLNPDGRLVVVTMERENAESDPFVRAYDWAFEHVPGYERFGCRPIYARRALESNGFAVAHRERHRRAHVWPVEVLLARPEE
jgi:ubiquinone/menaquinone biosynthesis C-methylase UbiE